MKLPDCNNIDNKWYHVLACWLFDLGFVVTSVAVIYMFGQLVIWICSLL